MWLAQGPAGEGLSAALLWEEPGVGEALGLRAAWVRPLANPSLGNPSDSQGSQSRPLLRLGDRVLIRESGDRGRIDVLFALDAPALAGRPALPLLLDRLLARLAGTELLNPTAAAARDPQLSRVAPQPLPDYQADFTPAAAPIAAAPFLIVAALALLVRDLSRGREAHAASA